MSILRDRRHLFLLSVVVITRLILIAYVYPDRDKMFNGDSYLYDGLAVNLVSEGRYYFDPYEPRSDLIRTPGYPLVIAANYFIFGENPLSVVLWNVVFVALIYVLLFVLLKALRAPPALAPFIILTLDLSWLLYSKELLAEPVFTCLLLGGVIILLKERERYRVWDGISAGVLIGIGAMVKPIALYLPLLLVIYLLIRKVRIVPIVAFVMAFVVVVGPWIIRNKVAHDTYTYTSIQSHNLLFAHGAFVYADANDVTHRAAQDSLFVMLEERLGGSHDEVAFTKVEAAEEQLAAEILTAHPVLYARAIIRGIVVTLFDPGRLVFSRTFSADGVRDIGLTNTVAQEGLVKTFFRMLQMDPVMVTTLLLYLAFLTGVNLLALAGVIPFYRTNRSGFALITLVAVYLLVLGGPNGYARFRLYVFPFLLVYASFGWIVLKSWINMRFRSRTPSIPSSA